LATRGGVSAYPCGRPACDQRDRARALLCLPLEAGAARLRSPGDAV